MTDKTNGNGAAVPADKTLTEDGLVNWESPKAIQLLKNTVAKGATPEEFTMFLAYCKSTGLNPWKKEIWFVKHGRQCHFMTGINGFFAVANAHPQYDGMGPVEFEVDADGTPISATVTVYRKDRSHGQTATAHWDEFEKTGQGGNWKKMPRHMLAKVAKSIALREAFPQALNGLYTQEEFSAEEEQEATGARTVEKAAEVLEAPSAGQVFADDGEPDWMKSDTEQIVDDHVEELKKQLAEEPVAAEQKSLNY